MTERSFTSLAQVLTLRAGGRGGTGGEFARFIMVGGIATTAHYVALLVGVEILAMTAMKASTAGQLVGAAISYYLNYHVTFAGRSGHVVALPRFAVMLGCGACLNAVVLWAAMSIIRAWYIPAQLLATSLVLTWNFCIGKTWAFK